MQRLALALLAVAALAAALALLWSGFRRMVSDGRGAGTGVAERGDGAVQKLAFVLLLGLVLYVTAFGGG